MRGWMSLDGEYAQIAQIVSADVQQSLATAMIDVGKIAASCSGVQQPCDVANTFKACKRVLQSITENKVNVSNDALDSKIHASFAELVRAYPSLTITSAMRKKTVHAVLSIVYTLKNTMRPIDMAKGFEECGHWPTSYEKIMSTCYHQVPSDQLVSIKEASSTLIQTFQTNGCITEADMDACMVPAVAENNSIPRDQRALSNQRAVLLTHTETLARYHEYKTRMEQRRNSASQRAANQRTPEERAAQADSRRNAQHGKQVERALQKNLREEAKRLAREEKDKIREKRKLDAIAEREAKKARQAMAANKITTGIRGNIKN